MVIPAYNEGENIVAPLGRLLEGVSLDFEIVVVVDFPEDTTIPVVERLVRNEPRIRVVVNTYGRGPANAIRFGIDAAIAPTVVVTMADGCDDPRQIDDLVRLVERGVVVAAASRYMPGGQQVGGPLLKSMLSRTAGRSLHLLTRIGTRDATNSFKAYDRQFVRDVGIHSRDGFEIGLELTAKARRLGRPVAETSHDLARPHGRRVEFQVGAMDPALSAVVSVRVRTPSRRGNPARRGRRTRRRVRGQGVPAAGGQRRRTHSRRRKPPHDQESE